MPRLSLHGLLDWVKKATWSFSCCLVMWGLFPTPSPAIYTPGPRELLLTKHSPLKMPLRSLPVSGQTMQDSVTGTGSLRSGIPLLTHFLFPLPDLPLPLRQKSYVLGAMGKASSPRGHGRVPNVAWLFVPFKGMT